MADDLVDCQNGSPQQDGPFCFLGVSQLFGVGFLVEGDIKPYGLQVCGIQPRWEVLCLNDRGLPDGMLDEADDSY